MAVVVVIARSERLQDARAQVPLARDQLQGQVARGRRRQQAHAARGASDAEDRRRWMKGTQRCRVCVCVCARAQYLEKSLEEEPGFSDAVMARNATRMYFNSYFPARDCVALSRPLESVSAVAPHTTERDELRAQFVESVDKFYSAYLSPKSNSALPAKQLMGSELRADQLAVVLETYVAALNANNLPTIAQASSTLLQRSIADGFEAARQIYDEAMAAVVASLDESSQALSSGELHVAHYRGVQQAMIRISELSASLPEQLRRAAFHDNLAQWESQLNSALATRVQQNQQLSRDASAALLERLLPHNLEEMASELASKYVITVVIRVL